MIPTAKEFRESKLIDSSHIWAQEEIMIEFAKLHVKAALEAALTNAYEIFDFQDNNSEVRRDSILNAYSETLIT